MVTAADEEYEGLGAAIAHKGLSHVGGRRGNNNKSSSG
jgi:hypothetical protein